MSELPPPPGVATPFDPRRAVLAWRALAHARIGSQVAVAGGILALVVVISVGWTALAGTGPAPPPELSLPRVAGPGDVASADGAADDTTGSGPTSGEGRTRSASDDVVVVHVAGAVARPGLYRLASEARIADAIDAAGGLAADADPDGVNLAAKVVDAERVYLPRRGEVPPGGPLAPEPGSAIALPLQPIDLNTATITELDALPGVGPATAAAIVEYRKEHGRFRSVDELLEVRGIGDAKLAAIRTKVRVR